MRWSGLLFASGLILISVPAYAQQFGRFSYREYEGWVEDSGNEVRVRLIPFLLGPDTAPPPSPAFYNFSTPVGHDGPKIQMLSDGRIRLPYKIIHSGGYPQDALSAIAQQSGVKQIRIAGAQTSFVQAKYSKVTLEISGEPIAARTFGGTELGGEVSESFYLPADRPELIDALKNDDYVLALDYEHGIADVKSLKLDMSTSQVSDMWVEAFREVTKSSSSSGGKFLFFNFSKRVSRTRVKEAVSSGASEQGKTDINIVLRDPTPDMEARVNTVLGLAQTSRADMLKRHEAAYAAALTAANPKLADAHNKYMEVMNADGPTDNGAALVAALSKLKDTEALQFMAAGFQMSDSNANSYYRYDYSMAVGASSEARLSYSEYLIKSSTVTSRYYARKQAGSMQSALAAAAAEMHGSVFPTANPGPLTIQQWAQGVAAAINSASLGKLRYAYSDDVRAMVQDLDPDVAIDGVGNRLIHLAAKKGNQAMLETMLRGGASPLAKNTAGDLPADAAQDNGFSSASDYLTAQAARTGTLTVTFNHTTASQLQLSNIRPAGTNASVQSLPGGGTRISFTDFARPVRFKGLARVQYFRPVACSSLGFQAMVQQLPNGCRIQQDIAFNSPVRIRYDQEARYRTGLVYMDNMTGVALLPFEI